MTIRRSIWYIAIAAALLAGASLVLAQAPVPSPSAAAAGPVTFNTATGQRIGVT